MTEPIRLRDLALAACVFFAATLVFTFPLALAPSELNRFDSPDALLNAWIVSWNLTQLARDPLHLFDANIFHPEPGTLAYSENLLTGSIVAAPIGLASDSPILLFNAVLVLAFVLTGVATFALALDVTSDRLAALLAGILFAFAPYRFAHIPHLQLQLAFGVPLSLLWARRLALGPGRGLAALGFAMTACAPFGSRVYYAVFVLAAAPILFATELLGVPSRERRAALASSTAACLGAALLTLPLALPYVDKLQGGSVRSLAAAEEFSAGLTEYLSSFSALHGMLPKSGEPLFPGFVAVALAVYALGAAPPYPLRRLGWVVIALLGAALSMGPALGLFTLLYRLAPPFRAIRVPSRAGVLVLVAVAVLAAVGLSRLKSRRLRALLVVVAAAECLAAPLPFRREEPSYPAIYRHVEALGGDGAMVELPLPPPERFQDNAIYVYRSIRHGRRMVNGYSGFAPTVYREAYRSLMRRSLARGLARAYEDGVRHVLAHEGRLGPRMRRQIREMMDAGTLRLVAEEGSDRLYAVHPSG